MLDARNVQLKVLQTSAVAAGVQRKPKKASCYLFDLPGSEDRALVPNVSVLRAPVDELSARCTF
jgi:hypothetical protein